MFPQNDTLSVMLLKGAGKKSVAGRCIFGLATAALSAFKSGGI